jgi:hypothetical protein
MASRPAFYPDSHARALERVMRVIDLIAGPPDTTTRRRSPPSRERASARWTLLIAFVPCALSFAVLKRMGIGNFRVPARSGTVPDSGWNCG